jgi:oxygen-independent coproporphyrinogen III oxidase
MTTPLGLYLHIPFCRQRCDFCAFYLEVHREPAAEAFCRAMHTEIRLHAADPALQKRDVVSVYVGGGTPTALKAEQLTALLTAVRQSFPLLPDCEVTVEAHPGTVTEGSLCALRQAGVTRISFGVESMDDDELAGLGRPGSGAETSAALLCARASGFTNINLDLMYGLPGQTVESWRQTLLRCRALNPTHLSCYALTVEYGTRLAREIQRGREPAPDDSLQIDMDRAAQHILGEAGYEPYEISNYARRGFECRHNLLYWTQGNYLGFGPSAQSYVGGVRFGNVPNLTLYEDALAKGRLPIDGKTALRAEEQRRDAVIFGLRLRRGVPTSQLNGHAATYGHVAVLNELRAGQLIEELGERSRLTAQGRLFADTIAEKLF